MPPSLPPLAVIAGPTASGKSAMALAMARARGGVVINADASQCYADLRILSARPTEEEERLAPHRLFGFHAGEQPLGAADWAVLARAEIDAAHAAGLLPIVVGGTGLYIRTLIGGIADVPAINADVREAVRRLSASELAAALALEDSQMAARLRPTDTQRMARALEVVRSTGRSLAEYQRETTGGIAERVALEPVVIDVDRKILQARCDARFEAMLKAGAVAEVRALMDRGLDPALPVMKAIGVPPLLAYLAGEISLDVAAERAKLDTRRYAKRQSTWFRNQTPDWPRVQG